MQSLVVLEERHAGNYLSASPSLHLRYVMLVLSACSVFGSLLRRHWQAGSALHSVGSTLWECEFITVSRLLRTRGVMLSTLPVNCQFREMVLVLDL